MKTRGVGDAYLFVLNGLEAGLLRTVKGEEFGKEGGRRMTSRLD